MPPNTAKKPDVEDEADFRIELTATEEKKKEEGRPVQAGALREEVPRLVSFEPPKRFKGKLFSLKNNAMNRNMPTFVGATGRSFNYEEMYGEDPYGEEAFPEARVWRVYNDEAQLYDLERIEAWRDAIDVLLVFIGLFAAVVSAFLIETSKALQPDYAQITAITTFAILRSLNSSVLPHSSFSPDLLNPSFGEATRENSVVNALWYTSLTISLSAALLAMLIKQWLHQYMTSTSGTSRERARMRQYRYDGLLKYQVPFIVDLLPTLLHLALALFLAGLALYLHALHTVMFVLVVGISALPYIFYMASIVIPLIDTQCPYRSPPSFYIYTLYGSLSLPLRRVWQKVKMGMRSACRKVHLRIRQPAPGPLAGDAEGSESSQAETQVTTWYSLNEAEKRAVSDRGNQLDVDGMVYLYEMSSNTNVRNIALEAFGGLPPSDADVKPIQAIVNRDLHAAVQGCRAEHQKFDNIPAIGKERRHDRLLRALCICKDIDLSNCYGITNRTVNCDQTDPLKIYSLSLLPCFKTVTSSLVPSFLCASQHSFPLSIWGTLIQRAKRQGDDIFIPATLVATLHLPLDLSEMGAVTLDRAMQNAHVRSIALSYLGITNVDTMDLSSLIVSSITSLLSKGNEKRSNERSSTIMFKRSIPAHRLSCILPPLFQSLTQRLRDGSLGDEFTEILCTILTNFFASHHINQLTWETLSSALDLWHTPLGIPIKSISTPSVIRRILCRFGGSHYNFLKEEDVSRIRNVASCLGDILNCYTCVPLDLSEAFCLGIQELDLIPLNIMSRGKRLTCFLLWSQGMCERVVDEVCKDHNSMQGLRWFELWTEYLQAPERRAFLCTRLVLTFSSSHLVKLCQLWPKHSSWLVVFKTILSLFSSQTYLESLNDWLDQPISHPQMTLSIGLQIIKALLQDNHPVLSQPEFDIPQIDTYDNVIPRASNSSIERNTTGLPELHSVQFASNLDINVKYSLRALVDEQILKAALCNSNRILT